VIGTVAIGTSATIVLGILIISTHNRNIS